MGATTVQRLHSLREELSTLVDALTEESRCASPEELEQAVAAASAVVNAAEAVRARAVADLVSVETRIRRGGVEQIRRDIGFIDDLGVAATGFAAGISAYAGGRLASLSAGAVARFPRLFACVASGDVAMASLVRVLSACAGLDATACTKVEDELAPVFGGLCPTKVGPLTRRIAGRVAPDQVAEHAKRNRRFADVQVSPGPEGLAEWSAFADPARTALAWSAVQALAATYQADDPELTVGTARATAFLDLLTGTATEVKTQVTLGIPVVSGDTETHATPVEHSVRGPREFVDHQSGEVFPTTAPITEWHHDGCPASGPATALGQGQPCICETLDGHGPPMPMAWAHPWRPGGESESRGDPGFSAPIGVSGCSIPKVGWISAESVAALIATTPLDVTRALLDSETGTLLETRTHAYRTPAEMKAFVTTRDGTCRMWGCNRPATACDKDHAEAWPSGATTPENVNSLCRRHHRLKQHPQWSHELLPDGTLTWANPAGATRTTTPEPHLVTARPVRVTDDQPPPF